MLEEHDQRLGPADIPAAGRQRLGQRPHPDFDRFRIDALHLRDAPARVAENAERVRLIHHQPGVVPRLHLDELREVGEVTVHRIKALDHHQNALVPPAHAGKRLIHPVEIIVWKGQPRRTGEARAFSDGIMDQLIHQDQVLRPQKRADCRHVGCVARNHGDRVIDAVSLRQRALQRAVIGPFAADEARGVGGYPPVFRRLDRRRPHLGMRAEAEIVVRGEIDLLFPVHHAGRALAAVDGAEEGGGDAQRLPDRLMKPHLLENRQG